VSIFRCPSTTDQLTYTTVTSDGKTIPNRYAISYAVNGSGSIGNPGANPGSAENPLYMDDGAVSLTGGFNNWCHYTDTPYRRDGAFYQNSKVRFEMITDGLSNTMAAGERVRLINNPAWYPENEYGNGAEYGTWFVGTMWAENHIEAATGSIGIPLNYNTQTTGYVRFEASKTAGAFSSKHTSGNVNILLMDGSVRSIAASTPDNVRLALGTIAGGETAPLP
jgi:hypothetical protein